MLNTRRSRVQRRSGHGRRRGKIEQQHVNMKCEESKFTCGCASIWQTDINGPCRHAVTCQNVGFYWGTENWGGSHRFVVDEGRSKQPRSKGGRCKCKNAGALSTRSRGVGGGQASTPHEGPSKRRCWWEKPRWHRHSPSRLSA